jgi:hypothetical protein
MSETDARNCKRRSWACASSRAGAEPGRDADGARRYAPNQSDEIPPAGITRGSGSEPAFSASSCRRRSRSLSDICRAGSRRRRGREDAKSGPPGERRRGSCGPAEEAAAPAVAVSSERARPRRAWYGISERRAVHGRGETAGLSVGRAPGVSTYASAQLLECTYVRVTRAFQLKVRIRC